MKTAGMHMEKVRYAVVGAGWITQAAFLPAIATSRNSALAALLTGDRDKAEALGRQYGCPVHPYEAYDEVLASGEVQAVYIALPNDMHRDYAERALRAGVHVLLEKPMAVGEAECQALNAAASASGTKLMIAYRLHFEPGTLEVIKRVRQGEIGEPRFFSSVFAQKVSPDNHRAQNGYWAGPVADMGTYPINAARNLFDSEPQEVFACGVRSPDCRFDFDDTVSVTMRFPADRVAQFTVSYCAHAVDRYCIVGTDGRIEVSPGYDFQSAIQATIVRGEAERALSIPATDQFGGQLEYFSDCILHDRKPEPDGEEGTADVRVIAAIERALDTGEVQRLPQRANHDRPRQDQVKNLPPQKEPERVDAPAPGGA